MTESVLPGVTIDVRAEGLIIPGRISVGTVGVVGTASKGPINEPRVLGSSAEARAVFGDYDPWTGGTSLTLVRTLELAFDQGAQRAIAVRIQGPTAAATAKTVLKAGSDEAVTISARSPGDWANSIIVTITKLKPDDTARLVVNENITVATGSDPKLSHDGIVVSDARTRFQVTQTGGVTVNFTPVTTAPATRQVQIDANGTLTFLAGEAPKDGDRITATYVVGKDNSTIRRFGVKRGDVSESFLALNPNELPNILTASTLVNATDVKKPNGELTEIVAPLAGGTNGEAASGPDYEAGLRQLLDQDAHIILAAGQGQDFADELAAHCNVASSDAWQRERIGIIGTAFVAASSTTERSDPGLDINAILGHTANSDRVILVGPGLRMTDSAADPPVEKVFPAAFTAAAFAGLLSSFDPEISPTNKPLSISGLEVDFTRAQLEQLVSARVTAIERRQGFLVVKGITTSTNTAFAQITTRRIVDFARIGVRSAALPYIGLLNNERVRAALRATVNSVLTDMLNAEMLTEYQVEVTATRDEEIKGIARVTLTLRPTFSIDFIQFTIFLQ